MLTCPQILGVVLIGAVAWPGALAQPSMFPENITTCEEFEKGAWFSPYAVIDGMWKIFYFWSNNTEVYPIVFALAAKNRVAKFREVFELMNPDLEVEWEKSTLFMNPRPGTEVLFLYAGTPGAFRAVVKQEQRTKVRPIPGPMTKFADVRMKIVHGILGMMCCEDLTAYALVKMQEVPKTEELCVKVASFIGYQGYEGRSYLYLEKKVREEEL